MESEATSRPLKEEEEEEKTRYTNENFTQISLLKKDKINSQSDLSKLIEAQKNNNKGTFVEHRPETEENLLTQEPQLTLEDDPPIPTNSRKTVQVPKLKIVSSH